MKKKSIQWVRNIIKNLPIIFPRVEGNSWKFPKMHLQLHIPDNIEIYGAPLNFDCTNGEHALQELDNLHLKPLISPLKKCQFSGNTRDKVLISSIGL